MLENNEGIYVFHAVTAAGGSGSVHFEVARIEEPFWFLHSSILDMLPYLIPCMPSHVDFHEAF